jgi:putative Mg2+ transporter-C (MgtC) family protein
MSLVNIILQELIAGLPDMRQFARLMIRLIIAMSLGAVVGAQRERTGKAAGLRTHMLVAMGAALSVLAPVEFGMDSDGVSRVIQGILTGIGFIGGGAILKLRDEQDIQGLTTAAGIWMTAAIGVAVGLGRLGLAVVSMAFTWITLSTMSKVEHRITERLATKSEVLKKK